MSDGIYLAGERITALSGAYSSVLLTPKPEPMMELNKAGVTLPLMWLLGDKHDGRSGMCASCTCKDGGCCEVYDPVFLQKLDSLASKAFPIDFYT